MPTLSPSIPISRRRLGHFSGRTIRRVPYNNALPYLLASLVLCATTLFSQVSGWILFMFMGCALWRALLEHSGSELPSMVVRLLIFLPSAAGVAMAYGIQMSAASLMAFLIVLLAMKMLELRTARDFTVVALLGYFMVLSALFYDQSFALCMYLGVAVLLNTVALIRVHLGTEARTLRPALPLACGLLLQATPLVILLFIIFPRVQVSFLHRLTNGKTGMTGMSDHLQPGSVESLVQSTETAFRVEINSPVQVPQAQLYWRGLVLAKCDADMSWQADSAPPQTPPPQPPQGNAVPPETGVKQTITIMPQGERWLFGLDRPIRVVPNQGFNPRLLVGTQQLRTERPLFHKAIYTVYSQLAQPAPLPLTEVQRKYYTRVPPDLGPRVAALVQSWQRGGTQPRAVLKAAEAYFRESNFTYSLQLRALPEKGALDHFLFDTKKGFCEHYASALGTLLRVAKIPSRLVVGYQGGEYNTWGKYYQVRQSDAHAWCEVWLDGVGWERVDPTGFVAPNRVDMGAESFAALAGDGSVGAGSPLGRLGTLGWVRSLSHNVTMAWESLDQQWNLMVIGYDPEKQTAFFEDLGLET